MDEYINKQAFIDNVKAVPVMGKYPHLQDLVIGWVNDAPPADVVPAVRCEECANTDRPDEYTIWCKGRGIPMQLVPPDGFCDKGRK